MDYLIDKKYLIMEDDEYPVVTLGNSNRILNEEQQVFMKLPEEKKKVPQSKKQSGSKQTENYQTTSEENTADSGELFEKLRKLRKEIAAQEGKPAYIIFSDAALKDMSIKKPVSLAQFSAINGVGSVKLEKYGEVFTALIREYCKN